MEIYGFIIMYYIYWPRDCALRILYIGQHFLYIVHFGGIHNFVYIFSILTILWLLAKGIVISLTLTSQHIMGRL